ncbi:hypothetical protein EJO50_07580 [Iodobacter ciconiae]|uniref:Uncharacterized protein n=1 Tax=Iodobacter ciconiae TaxID=2496266 RepID=A0A3S8ZSH0_9NEIS|nr:hypothetical protein EJO50_07580 [Iodobacter ciconiae]
MKRYNHHIPQKALGSITPIAALKNWQNTRPELFIKQVYDHAKPTFFSALNEPPGKPAAERLVKIKHKITAD